MQAQKYFLSLGSNLGNRALFLKKALLKLEKNVGEIQKISSVYESAAVGFKGFHFYNIAIEMDSFYAPSEVLKKCLSIEKNLGRKPQNKIATYKNRPIDIDLILCENLILKTENLILPHPRALERKFVLVPLCEIAPDIIFSGTNKNLRFCSEQCPDKNILKNKGPLNRL